MADAPRSPRRRQAPSWLAEDGTDPFAFRRPNATPATNAAPDAPLDDFGETDGVDSLSRMPKLMPPTIPSLPRARRGELQAGNGDSAKRRTLMAGTTGRQGAVRPPASGAPRTTRKVPAVAPFAPNVRRDDTYRGTPDERNGGWDGDDEQYDDGYDDQEASGRRWRQKSAARPLALQRVPDPELWAEGLQVALPVEEMTPDLAVYRPRSVAPRSVALRTRQATRALVRSARSPWARVRFALAILAICIGLWTAVSAAGEPSQPLMATWKTTAGAHDARAITTLVQAETQGTRPDLYDSQAQFNDWWDAACSAAVMSEVLTAWGVPHATIGKMIDVMQPDISLNGGLLTTHGFVRGASAFGYRADISSHLTYKQMLYLTNTLGLPVIVNVRISYGYYHFFSGGHFLVMTGGDSQGLKIVDSSEYYIKYLPLDTFNSMFTGITAVVVPNGYTYSLPS